MKPRTFIVFFAFLALTASVATVHFMEAVSGVALVVGVAIGAALGLAAAMSCVRRYSTEGLPPPIPLRRRIVIYAIGLAAVWVLSLVNDKLPSVPGVGGFVRTGGWVVLLVMAATASAGVSTWWRFAGRPEARQ